MAELRPATTLAPAGFPSPIHTCTTGRPVPLPGKGTLHKQNTAAVILRIVGAAPISATGYEMERLRCDTCGAVFTAPPPPEAGTEKFASSVGPTVALLRYGCGMPHYRLAKLQKIAGSAHAGLHSVGSHATCWPSRPNRSWRS